MFRPSFIRALWLFFLCSLFHIAAPLEPTNGTVGGSGPVIVYLSFVPVQVAKVDVTVQNNYLDVYVTMSWQDASVSECGPDGSGSLDATPSTWTAWAPSPVFVNHVEDGTGSRDFTQAFCGAPPGAPPHLGTHNWTNFYGRVTGTFVSQMQMRDFPQDTQTTVLQLESDSYDETMLTWEYVAQPEGEYVHTGWLSLGSGFVLTSHYYPGFAATYAQGTFQMRMRRDPTYYYMRYVLNIGLLVTMSLFGAILSPLETSRIMLSVTLFLGVVSWMFVLVVDAPKSNDPTRMDAFFIASFLVLLLQALYFTVRNHNFDATLAPVPFWKAWLVRGDLLKTGESSPHAAQHVKRRRGKLVRPRPAMAPAQPLEGWDDAGAPPATHTLRVPPAANPGFPPDFPPRAPLGRLYSEGAARRFQGGAAAAHWGPAAFYNRGMAALQLQHPGGASGSGKEEGLEGAQTSETEDAQSPRAARSGTREQQEAEFVTERVRESMVVNAALMVAYASWVACIFLLP
jgi:hypothetical protein